MCDAMERLMNASRDEGRVEETKNTILRLWKKGKSLADIVDATDWSPEKINEFLRSRNIRPAQ